MLLEVQFPAEIDEFVEFELRKKFAIYLFVAVVFYRDLAKYLVGKDHCTFVFLGIDDHDSIFLLLKESNYVFLLLLQFFCRIEGLHLIVHLD